MRESGGSTAFFHSAAARSGPVFQVPIGPAGTWLSRLTGLGEVLVTCADGQEIEDACSRKATAFAKGPLDTEPFKVAFPTGQLALFSGPQHRHHRRVFGPSMSGACLARMVPRIEVCVDNLVSLWTARTARARVQGGKPINVAHDLAVVANDVITDLAFGKAFGAIDGIREHLDTAPESPPDSSPAVPRLVECIDILFPLFLKIAFSGPIGRLLTFYYRNISSRTRRARQDVVEMMETRIAAERALREGQEHRDGPLIPHDADHILGMALDGEEVDMLKGGTPLSHNEVRASTLLLNPKLTLEWSQLCDELLTFVFAGSETTAATLAWAVKLLSRNPTVQRQLRSELIERLPGALRPSQPDAQSSLTFDQLNDETLLPFSTATIYECIRVSQVAGLTGRTTMCDTTVLGHPVPAGTRVCFLTGWEQAKTSAKAAGDSEERATQQGRRSRHSQRKWGYWGDDVTEFRPERWLKQRLDGTMEFDRWAGPWMPFGAGPRGCFGRNLAILELKVFFYKLVGAFHFEAVPANLDGDSSVETPARHPVQCYVRLTPMDPPSARV